jgi:hypothetical protein
LHADREVSRNNGREGTCRLRDSSVLHADREVSRNNGREGTCRLREASYADATSVARRSRHLAAALEAIPEDWCRTWAAGRTIMLRRTSKRVKEVVDKMCLPAVVRLSRSFRDDACNGTAAEKLQFVMRQLQLITAWCRIITLELPSCGHERTRCREACRSAGAVPSAGSPRSPLQ